MCSHHPSYRRCGLAATQSSARFRRGATFVRMRRTESRSGQPGEREPSPPFGHVSWREGVEYGVDHLVVVHDAADDMAVLAETVMGRDGVLRRPQRVPGYLAKIAKYPLWAVSVRALVGAAVLPVPMFLYGGSRYHYLVQGHGQYRFDQNALLAGVVIALLGAFVGMLAGAAWGLLVVRYARSSVRARDERGSGGRGGDG